MSDVLDPIRAAIEARRTEWSQKLDEASAAQAAVDLEIKQLADLEQQHTTLLRSIRELELNRAMYAKMVEDAETEVEGLKAGIVEHLLVSGSSYSADGRRLSGDSPYAEPSRLHGAYSQLVHAERIVADGARVLAAADAAIAAKQQELATFIEDNELGS